MIKVLFATNIPSPYRVDFFNELGKYCELTVTYERKTSTEREEKWKGDVAKSFTEVYLNLTPIGTDRSRGHDLKNYIKHNRVDVLILTNYVSPSTMEAICFCKLNKIPYYIEYDGGFNRRDSIIKLALKKFLLCSAAGHFTTAEEHKKYLLGLGIAEANIYKYPFTSIRQEDIYEPLSKNQKKDIRDKLEITEDKVVIAIGQFIYRKGFDLLLEASVKLDKKIGVYIIGGYPIEEYVSFKSKHKLNNVHFIGFKTKQELNDWYLAADVFVLPTREDIWGLVVNEAMAHGIPVVTTNKCIAGLEMVRDARNGYIVPSENVNQLREKIQLIIDDKNRYNLECNSINMAKEYTIEKMALKHIDIIYSIIERQ